MIAQQPLHVVADDCNTFSFFVSTTKPTKKNPTGDKLVTIEQVTDWTGTEWENDPIMCRPSQWIVTLWHGYTDTQAINVAGRKILKDWKDI